MKIRGLLRPACPCCRNAKTDGHKPGCILKQFIDKGGKNEETVNVRNLRNISCWLCSGNPYYVQVHDTYQQGR